MNGAGFLSEFKNAFNRPNSAHTQLIIINAIFFVFIGVLRVFIDHSLVADGSEVLRFIALPSNLEAFIYKPWTIITYMFTHIGFFHLLFNMLMLFWFGKIIVEFLGGAKVLKLYVLGGLAGGLFYMLLYNVLPLYKELIDFSILFGASAGVLAVVVGAATFMPNYSLHLIFIGPVQIKYIALIVIVLSFLQSTGANAGGELAHLGGAFMGFIYVRQLQKGNDWGNWVISVITFVKSLFAKQPDIKVSYKKKPSTSDRSTRQSNSSKSSSTSPSYKIDQEEIDAILDKISEKGYESLSKEEKQKLFNASKK